VSVGALYFAPISIGLVDITADFSVASSRHLTQCLAFVISNLFNCPQFCIPVKKKPGLKANISMFHWLYVSAMKHEERMWKIQRHKRNQIPFVPF